MKPIITSFIVFLLSISMFSQSDSIALFPDGVPGLKDNNLKESITFNNRGTVLVHDVTEPYLFPYLPEGADAKTPAVVICPGGGYWIVSTESEGFNVAEWLADHGVAAFVLKYRIPNDKAFDDKSIAPLQDVQQAFSYIMANADHYNVDKKKVGIMGFSAGGHLAASASVLYNDPLVDEKAKRLRPAFSALIYPVITFTDECMHLGSKKNLIGPEWTTEQEQRFSCELQVDKNTPPTFLLHAKDDKTVPYKNSLLYKAALDENGVDNKLILIETGGHGFGLIGDLETNVWIEDFESWLRTINVL